MIKINKYNCPNDLISKTNPIEALRKKVSDLDQMDFLLDLQKGTGDLSENLDRFIEAMSHYEISRQRDDIGADLATCYVMLYICVHKFGYINEFDEMVRNEVNSLDEQYFTEERTESKGQGTDGILTDYSAMEF